MSVPPQVAYNEYWQVIDGGYNPSQLVVFKYEDEGVATLEDGLWVLEKNLKDPAFVAKMAKFVKASMKGWDYAKNHPDEAVKIILAGDSTGAKTEKDQKRMMLEVGKLLGATDGKLDVKDYDRTVATLLAGGSDPVITRKPEGAYSFAVYDAMKQTLPKRPVRDDFRLGRTYKLAGVTRRYRVCFTHKASEVVRRCNISRWAISGCSLFNYIVGACDDIWRDFEAEFLGGLKIYDQVETRGLFDWKVAWTGTL
jgi:NMT1/THI5 like